jgi:phage terminase large subunit-like protein
VTVLEIPANLMGVQQPRIACCPQYATTLGDAAIELARMAGLELDPWQQWLLRNALGQTDETYWNPVLGQWMPKSSAYEIGVVLARQNGKGAFLEALELAWLFLAGIKTIVHSAHEFATSREHFQRIEGLITNTPELKGELARGGIKWSHGDESITLATGQRLLFKTRTKGAIRGFSPDKIVMDEAMILKQEAVKAMMYAMSARPDAQIVYTGSAGDEESEHFGRVRERGIKQSDPRLFFAEWSADTCDILCRPDCTEHDDPADPLTWAKANPALGYRIQAVNIQSEYQADPEGFLQERLSVGNWPKTGEAWAVIPESAWKARIDELSGMHTTPVFSIDTSPDQKWSCIAAVGGNGEDGVHGEITGREMGDGSVRMDYRPGTRWVIARAKEIHEKNKRATWVIDKGTQAGTYIPALEKAGLKIISPTTREVAQACGDFYAAVVPRGEGQKPDFWHIDQPELTTAVANAGKRELADLWAWDKRNSASDICPLVAVTNALWGYRQTVNKPKPKPMAAWGR